MPRMTNFLALLPAILSLSSTTAFTLPTRTTSSLSPHIITTRSHTPFLKPTTPTTTTSLPAAEIIPDLQIVGLVVGQENYGFAVVAVGEAIWSFTQAPSLAHAKILIPASLAAVILVAVSGPMVTSGDLESVGLGLKIATGTSVLLGGSYLARLLAPYSPSAKEIAFLGLLVALAGFFSFSQNLVVNGFVVLPQLPHVPLPTLPSFSLPSFPSF